jgi:hypothetical protein
VTAESKLYRLRIEADARLAAGAGGLAHFLGEAAGLSADAATELQKSVVAACNEAFENMSGEHAHLNLTFAWYADRIEVAVAQEGDVPAVGLDRIAGFAEQIGSMAALSGIDRVQFEAKDGTAITRLTKYLRAASRMV